MDACLNNQDCLALLDCLYECYDETCANACASTYPDGMDPYIDVTVCAYCQACPASCAAEAQGFCY